LGVAVISYIGAYLSSGIIFVASALCPSLFTYAQLD